MVPPWMSHRMAAQRSTASKAHVVVGELGLGISHPPTLLSALALEGPCWALPSSHTMHGSTFIFLGFAFLTSEGAEVGTMYIISNMKSKELQDPPGDISSSARHSY